MPHLAASPDGLIHNGSNTMLLEIKCTFNVDRLELEELAERSNFCLVKTEGQWELKRSHRNFWLDMFEELNEFYLRYYLPALMAPEVDPAEDEE
ncbi:hypothetical protein JTE90_006848 [Oedothorax gibbosus]|uniref:YqaJ viral recombinase domain-containing protein n=1 Tax=Oedothorax gibbosus TaxID=931172 RepID=A0AAV6TIF9_9ARAC|nr:hypothetical protein JTE90_006848 [Oedothorax gibbosus]